MKKQTSGRDVLGQLAPTFAAINDDVLFGQVWAREDRLSARDRSLITCASLMSQGLFPQLESHLKIAKGNGVTKDEVVEMITQLSFYAGWPKAWSAFPLVTAIFGDDEGQSGEVPDHGVFPLGEPADGPNFTGHVWLHMMTDSDTAVSAGNVTFEAGCVNRWHTHPLGQLLLVTAGQGWEQEEGKPAHSLAAGDAVFCPPNVRHWHGAARGSSFTHVAVTPVSPEQGAVEWLEFPDAESIAALEK